MLDELQYESILGLISCLIQVIDQLLSIMEFHLVISPFSFSLKTDMILEINHDKLIYILDDVRTRIFQYCTTNLLLKDVSGNRNPII